jgi:endonuclease III-like uncharacterized protein
MKRNEGTLFADMLTAVLAVNNFRLEDAYVLVSRLQVRKVVEPEALLQLSVETLAAMLVEEGYSRGKWMAVLMAKRLKAVATAMSGEELNLMRSLERRNEHAIVRARLLQIHGVGNGVVTNFLRLRGASE